MDIGLTEDVREKPSKITAEKGALKVENFVATPISEFGICGCLVVYAVG